MNRCMRPQLTGSFQMFEHMKNYKLLMAKVASWLRPNGAEESLFFVHIFCHKTTPYHFEEGDGWMSKQFFSGVFLAALRNVLATSDNSVPGGTMPSHDLLVSILISTFAQRFIFLSPLRML